MVAGFACIRKIKDHPAIHGRPLPKSNKLPLNIVELIAVKFQTKWQPITKIIPYPVIDNPAVYRGNFFPLLNCERHRSEFNKRGSLNCLSTRDDNK
jgi:hypothetical protein